MEYVSNVQMNKVSDYHGFYLKTVVLLLADAFEMENNWICLFYYFFWLEGNISSPVRYLLILPDDKADIFAASPLISCWSL